LTPIFFLDAQGNILTDAGFFEDSNIRQDKANQRGRYILPEARYDAAIICQAVMNVKRKWDIAKENLAVTKEMREATDGPHSLYGGLYRLTFPNCQDFTDAVLNEAISIARWTEKKFAHNNAAIKELERIEFHQRYDYFTRPSERMLPE
jgi:hypothetical protein